MLRSTVIGFLAMTAALLPLEAVANASPADPALPHPPPPSPEAGAPASPREEAHEREIERQVTELFERGDYAAALPLTQAEYERTHAPRWLFNLAMIHHALGDCRLALYHYELYLRSNPGPRGRAEATTASANLTPLCGEGPPAPEALPIVPLELVPPGATRADAVEARAPMARIASSASESAEHDSTRALVGWSLVGAGAAAGVTAVVSLALAIDAGSSLNDLGREAAQRSRTGETYDDCCAERGRELESTRQRYSTLAPIVGVGSLLLMGAGATLLVLDAGEQRSLVLRPGGVDYRLSF